MTIDKALYDKRELSRKISFLADLQRRFEEAKAKGFKGDIKDFKNKIMMEKIKSQGHAKGGPVKPNGPTTFTSDDWDLIIEGQNFPHEIFDDSWTKAQLKTRPKKVAFKYGATSQSEEDLIGSHVDEWTNLINKGELDPSVSFMKYLDMILGRSGVNRGGIISVI